MSKSLRLAPLAITALAAAAVFSTAAPRDAHALMALQDTALEGGGGGGTYTTTTTTTTNNKIVYLHGRSMGTWPAAAKLAQSGSLWNHVVLNYNGSARIYDSTVRATVANALLSNCSGTNQCVVVCYSAGCARMLYALDELAAKGTPANRIVWITATASAAGGTEVAEAATKWYAKVLAKIFGGGAAIDDDLKRSVLRGTYGYIQNRAPVSMYHLAGSKNMCRKILFVKLCGNKYFPGSLGDGAVPPHSSCGFASSGYFPNCSGAYGAKYTNRVSQQDALYPLDHVGMVGAAVIAASTRLAGTSTLSTGAMQGETSDPDADTTYDDGDETANSTNQNQLTDGLGGSIDPNIVSSDTCGGGTCTSLSSTALTGSSGGGSGTLQYALY